MILVDPLDNYMILVDPLTEEQTIAPIGEALDFREVGLSGRNHYT